ncbi:MAG: hypothetical protein HZC25_08395 [Rhodospirillales bacterium]|nr:hypothetical protein [Rhodospirillales bacterium]
MAAKKSKAMSWEYTGKLAEPIEFPINALATKLLHDDDRASAEFSKAWAAVVKIRMEKFDALLREFGFDSINQPNALLGLSLGLAERHVPGFRVEFQKLRGRGRPRRDDIFDLGTAVLEFVQRTGLSERNACYSLAKKGQFKNAKGSTLYRRWKTLKARGASKTFLEGIKAI